MERLSTREKLFAAGLSGLAGFIDSVGFIQSKGFFVSFMSGNSTRFGVGVAWAILDALAALGLILAFVLGVTAGSLIGSASGRHRIAAVLLAVAVLLACAATLGGFDQTHTSLALMAAAMGAENATFEYQGKIRVGLTYMAGSVVRVGQAIAGKFTGAGETDWRSPLTLWVGFVVGAVAGAMTALTLGLSALWIASAAAVLFACIGRMFTVVGID